MNQQRISNLIQIGPLNFAVILIIVVGLVSGGLFALQASQVTVSDTSPSIRLSPISRAQAAEAARYQALADYYLNQNNAPTWNRAIHPLTGVQIAEAARLNGLAGGQYNLYGSTAWTRAPKPLTRAQMADAARLNAIAGGQYNLYGSTAWTRAPKLELNRAQLTEAARLTALAIHYGKPPASISPSVASLIP